MKYEENVSLLSYNTFKVPSLARYLFHIKSIEELKKALIFIKDKKIPFIVLGGGSNILLVDEEYVCAFLKIEIDGLDFEEKEDYVSINVGAGILWDDLVSFSIQKGFYGIENLSGIPGTVGASPIQNIGAYGTEVSDFIEEVSVFDVKENKIKSFKNKNCYFGYRESIFKKEKNRFIVINVKFKLGKKFIPNITYKDLKEFFKDEVTFSALDVRNAVLKIRKNKFPDLNSFGTAGSFFKNLIVDNDEFLKLKEKYPNIPAFDVKNSQKKKVSSAWILDRVLNLKGFEEGGVSLFERQPIVIVSSQKTSGKKIKNFSDKIKKIFFEKIKLELEEEVVFIENIFSEKN